MKHLQHIHKFGPLFQQDIKLVIVTWFVATTTHLQILCAWFHAKGQGKELMKYILLILCFSLAGCSSAKLVVKNCEKAGNADLYICDRI